MLILLVCGHISKAKVLVDKNKQDLYWDIIKRIFNLIHVFVLNTDLRKQKTQ